MIVYLNIRNLVSLYDSINKFKEESEYLYYKTFLNESKLYLTFPKDKNQILNILKEIKLNEYRSYGWDDETIKEHLNENNELSKILEKFFAILKSSSHGVKHEKHINWSKKVPFSNNKASLQELNKEELTNSIYFIDDLNYKDIIESNSILINNYGNEIKTLNKIINKFSSEGFPKYIKANDKSNITNSEEFWEEIFTNKNNLTDILINDLFLFKESNFRLIDLNLIPFLKHLLKGINNEVNIVIVTNMDVPSSINLNERFEEIKVKIDDLTKQKVHLTIITDYSKNHFRCAITNYDYINIEKGVTFFEKTNDGQTINGRDFYIDIKTNENKGIYQFSSEVTSVIEENLKSNNNYKILGPKRSNLIKF